MARQKFIAGNWKLNLSIEEGTALVQGIAAFLAGRPTSAEVAVCPTALALAAVAKAAVGSPVGVGGQHCHWEEKGAFTGEVSASLLKNAGAKYVLLGHSERRQYFGETDATVNKRLGAVLKQSLVPILCIGETLAERQGNKLQQVLETQVKGALAGFTPEQLATLVVAYEPVWAIGTGVTATTAQAQEAHAFVRTVLRSVVGGLADRVRIQYGGSVKPDNAKEILSQPDVDGALVGGAALKVADFTAIIAAA
ncbi:MAG: triose-phosphate isomerase [Planctomycetota bacterium]